MTEGTWTKLPDETWGGRFTQPVIIGEKVLLRRLDGKRPTAKYVSGVVYRGMDCMKVTLSNEPVPGWEPRKDAPQATQQATPAPAPEPTQKASEASPVTTPKPVSADQSGLPLPARYHPRVNRRARYGRDDVRSAPKGPEDCPMATTDEILDWEHSR